jgi:glycosyltransferase involved in cell wall biosynthesis
MAMELAVVSTNVGAIPEIVDNRVNGILVESGNYCALADTIETLARDPALRRQLGQAAGEKIAQQFDIRRNAEQFAILFTQSLICPPPGRP